MRRVFSIAVLTVRHAIRSRVVLLLLGLLLLLSMALPLTVVGDGTLAGQVQLVLSYTLGSARLLLSLVIVWAGCAAISTELRDRHLDLLMTKPLRAGELWLGKWLGLVVMAFVLLACAGVLTYGLLRWTMRPSQLSEADRWRLQDEILVARRVVRPAPFEVEAAAREALARRKAAGDLPPGASDADALAAMREQVRLQAGSVPQGSRIGWVFRLPSRPSAAQPLFLEYTFASSREEQHEVTGLWMVGPEPDDLPFRHVARAAPGGVYSLRIPPEAVGDDRRLILEYANIESLPLTVLFLHDDDVRLLLHSGSFAGNYLRSLLVMAIQLSFLAAIGVTAGACLSLPVAAFAAAWLVLMLQIGSHLETLAGQRVFFGSAADAAASPGAANRLLRWLFRLLHVAFRPLESANPIEHLITGRLVGWDWVALDALVKLVLYSGLLGLLGYGVLSRREVGLPS